jgi:hypothetical protein
MPPALRKAAHALRACDDEIASVRAALVPMRAAHAEAVTRRSGADFLVGYLNDVIDAMTHGRPDLTPQQQATAVLAFARGVTLRMRLRLPLTMH